MPFDVAVVGAGPVGSFTAKLLASAGYSVALIEEHDEVGRPVQCAGLFTPRVFELLDFDASSAQRNPVRGAHVHSPKGHRITIESDAVQAIATDRAAFDQLVAERAAKAGAELRLGTKATAAHRTDGGIHVELQSESGPETLKCRLLVGADGVQSQVAKWFGLGNPREILSFVGAEMDGVRLDPGFVEMFTGQTVAPGFFSYCVPTNREGTRGKVEAGVWKAPKPAQHYFEQMFTHPVSRRFVEGAEARFRIVGCVPLGPLRRFTASHVMLVGDAASQAKPASGGGVFMGLAAARIAADVAGAALKSGDLSASRLAEYDERFQAELGKELRFQHRLRRAFMFLGDDQVEDLFIMLDDPELLRLVNMHGDIDYPSRVAFVMLKKAPQLFKFSGAWLKSLLYDVPKWEQGAT